MKMKARQRKQGRVEEGWFLVALLQLPLAPGVSPTFSAPGKFDNSAPVSEKIGKEFTGTRKEIFRTLRAGCGHGYPKIRCFIVNAKEGVEL